ncbi:hypothetical protein QBC33DRAFT_545719 [Phialemonium atrogriseum]|uniref:Uncharacterized protein n=1 Tax=Phialemonium atrogriseum TaxID=1093897 RepID=A0AAJ0BX92_9PEZI|nr:uncharacterized protein QBC33DRAFT_545719 [Phialemonium atrogriseum]KAK1765093.1 hypothetical protein QBC33DRAFT_545719 [Phialemonium atrogriseum]
MTSTAQRISTITVDPITSDGKDAGTLLTPASKVSNAHVELSVKDFQTFISFIFSISIFGASTFAVIVGQMTDPADIWKPGPPPFTMSRVRTFLAVAWLCFVLALAVAGYSSSVLTLWRQRAGGEYDGAWVRKWDAFGIAASALLHLLIVMAFLFLSLALVAYVGVVGWIAVGFSSLALFFVAQLSIFQCL